MSARGLRSTRGSGATVGIRTISTQVCRGIGKRCQGPALAVTPERRPKTADWAQNALPTPPSERPADFVASYNTSGHLISPQSTQRDQARREKRAKSAPAEVVGEPAPEVVVAAEIADDFSDYEMAGFDDGVRGRCLDFFGEPKLRGRIDYKRQDPMLRHRRDRRAISFFKRFIYVEVDRDLLSNPPVPEITGSVYSSAEAYYAG